MPIKYYYSTTTITTLILIPQFTPHPGYVWLDH